MPEVEDAMRLASHEAGSKNNICPIFDQRLEKDGVFGGIVFKIGILHDDVFGRGVFEASTQCRAFTLIYFVKNRSPVQRQQK